MRKHFLATFAPILLGTLLSAQDSMALQFEKELKNLTISTLVFLDGPKSEWRKDVDRLLQTPGWSELELQPAYFQAEAPKIETVLKERVPQFSRPGWMLLGPGGKVAASGARPPTVAVLEKALAEAGIKSTSQMLREFLHTHPGHLEAKGNLLAVLMNRSSAATRIKLGLKVEPLRPADQRLDMSEWIKEQEERRERAEREEKDDNKKSLKELRPEDDLLIWSEYAELLDRLFRSGEWRNMGTLTFQSNETAKHSPILKEVLRRALPEVEDALQDQPTDWSLWKLWLAMSDAVGGRPLAPLVDRLVPSPLQDPGSWPPEEVKDRYLKDAQARRDWQATRDLLMPIWERRKISRSETKGRYRYVEDGKIGSDPWASSSWRQHEEPLVEALLMLGELNLADQLVRFSWANNPWEGLPAKASALARRCNQPSLAATWAALAGDRPR